MQERICKEKFRITEKGITLIALVITIIVLLILAGVSIATLTGDNGILTKARDASRETEITSVKEQAQIDIANWIAGQLENGGDGIIDEWGEVKKVLDEANPIEENRYYKNVTEEGVETPNGYIIPIEELYTTGSSVAEVPTRPIQDLKEGDKVYYIDKNGTKRECTVLYDSTSEYGVQIITTNVVEDEVSLGDKDETVTGSDDFEKAKNSYNNALKRLYDEAQKYLNTTYASSARYVGSDPADPDWDTTTNEAGYYTKEVAEGKNKYHSYMETGGWYNNVFKNEDEKYKTDWTQMGTIPGIKGDELYWLASRRIDSDSSNTKFVVRHVTGLGSLGTGIYLLYVNSDNYTPGLNYTFGFRPVFTLKSEVKIAGGDGVNIPYTLVP